ncbi:MAG: hypothetical protein ACQERC_04030 [Bacteroidota bacterium]
MKSTLNLAAAATMFFGAMLLMNGTVFSQGNNGGNANPNNNANGNALKWETQGNNADTSHFIGTTNPTALKMRTNNVERLRIRKDGSFYVKDSAFFMSPVTMNSVDSISDLKTQERQYLLINEDGLIEKTGRNTLLKDFYDPYYSPCSSAEKSNLSVTNPVWHNGPYKLFSECPEVDVGIGTKFPNFKLDVRGMTGTGALRVGTTNTNADYALIKGMTTNAQPILTLGKFSGAEEKRLELKSDGGLDLYHYDNNHQWTGDPINAYHEGELIMKLNASGELALNHNSSAQGATDRVLTISNSNRKIVYVNAIEETLYARRIKIDQDPWSDHVFEKNYELMPLHELNSFIQTNGHLPEVPTTEEVQENGVDLAENNALLLKKIEELTLYLLEQKEETEALRKELKELRKKVDQQ